MKTPVVVVRATAKFSVHDLSSVAERLESHDLTKAYGRQFLQSAERLEVLRLVLRARESLTRTGRRRRKQTNPLVLAMRRGYSMCALAAYLLEGQPCVIEVGPVPLPEEEDMRRMLERIKEEEKLQRAAYRWHTCPVTLAYDPVLRSFSTKSKLM